MGLILLHQNLAYVGIKPLPFSPSRVGKDENLYKSSSSSSYELNVTENIQGTAFCLLAEMAAGRRGFPAANEMRDLY